MRIKTLSIGIILLLLSGCSNQTQELEVSLATIKDKNIVLTSELENLAAQNKDLLDQIELNKTKFEETSTKHSKELLDINIENQVLLEKILSLEEELTNTKSWTQYSNQDSTSLPITDDYIINLLDKLTGEDIPPIYGVILCDTYINHIQNVENRNAMIYTLHESLVKWEMKYNARVKSIIDETVAGDYQVRMRAEWAAISKLESDISELQEIETIELRDLLLEAKYSGYTAASDEEFVGFEHDRSFLISKYGEMLSED